MLSQNKILSPEQNLHMQLGNQVLASEMEVEAVVQI